MMNWGGEHMDKFTQSSIAIDYDYDDYVTGLDRLLILPRKRLQ